MIHATLCSQSEFLPTSTLTSHYCTIKFEQEMMVSGGCDTFPIKIIKNTFKRLKIALKGKEFVGGSYE